MYGGPDFFQAGNQAAVSMGAPSPTSSSSCISNCRLFGSSDDEFGDVPRDPKSLLDAEKAITQELYELSMQEREGALHDIHGVADEIEEHPEFVQTKLNELENELQKSTTTSSTSGTANAYRTAKRQSPDYVCGLYLMFLRCELFDVKLAAERIMTHFDMKQELFGVEKLGRDIVLSDFSRADKECLESGFMQLLPQRDRAGRVVFVNIWYHQTYKERANVWRSIWYLEMTMMQDELTQKKGKIFILYNVNPNWIDTFDRDLFKGVGRLKKATPVRTVAAHYCFSDPAFGAIIKFLSMIMDRKTRTRSRLHKGTHVEVQYDLLSFGVPMSALPLSSDGTMNRKVHLKWLKTRKSYEALKRKSNHNNNLESIDNIVLIPSHVDVLFGRGRVFQIHLGNMKLGQVLEEESARYFDAKREEKAGISMEIVRQMKKDGARFLRQSKDGLWIEVDDKTASDKVGHGFRNRKALKAAAASTSTTATTNNEVEGEPTTTKTSSSPDNNSTHQHQKRMPQITSDVASTAIVLEYMTTKRYRLGAK